MAYVGRGISVNMPHFRHERLPRFTSITDMSGKSHPAQLRSLAAPGFPWYRVIMESTPFELTPEQKGMLASLSREAGKPLPTLLAAITAALEELQEHERLMHEHGMSNGHEPGEPATAESPKPFWQKAIEASQRIPDEELERLPADLAAHVDHYIYGTPKR
jgi:hypothetical protein